MSNDKMDQAVFKIFRATHEGNLGWIHKPAPELWLRAGEAVIPIYFETYYQGRKLALFQRSSRTSEMDKYVKKMMNEPVDEWNQSVHLALLGDNDELMFEFPRSRQIRDLFEAVRYKEANVDEFLDKVLNSEPASEK